MRSSDLLLCTLLIVTRAFAQNPLEVTEREPATEPGRPYPASVAYIAPPLPPAPVPKQPKVIDLKFVIAMSTLAAAESTRYTTRRLVLENEQQAGDPFIGNIPSRPQFVAKTLAIYAAESVLVYEIKKPHGWMPADKVIRRLWWVYPAAMAQAHFRNASGSIHTTGPGGCTSELTCQAP